MNRVVGNQFLQNEYCDQLNEKFAVSPRSAVDFHRSAKGYDLASIFCIEEERTLTAELDCEIRESVLSAATSTQGTSRQPEGAGAALSQW